MKSNIFLYYVNAVTDQAKEKIIENIKVLCKYIDSVDDKYHLYEQGRHTYDTVKNQGVMFLNAVHIYTKLDSSKQSNEIDKLFEETYKLFLSYQIKADTKKQWILEKNKERMNISTEQAIYFPDNVIYTLLEFLPPVQIKKMERVSKLFLEMGILWKKNNTEKIKIAKTAQLSFNATFREIGGAGSALNKKSTRGEGRLMLEIYFDGEGKVKVIEGYDFHSEVSKDNLHPFKIEMNYKWWNANFEQFPITVKGNTNAPKLVQEAFDQMVVLLKDRALIEWNKNPHTWFHNIIEK